ncbi:hypothetical protein JB92DRAFT_2883793 [Gautieria morchelliformis]|nr:hypothetical protein JB92DRAFT_2883793 [Gautieria morchelliformis]
MSPRKRKRAEPVTTATIDTLSVPQLEALLHAAKVKKADSSVNKRPRKPKPEAKPALVKPGHKAEGKKLRGDEASIPPVPWAKEHDLTDMLLTVLEDDPVMRAAFSMDKGAESKNKSSAKTVADHHCSLALRVLIPHHSGRWKDASLVQMGNVVKNRVNAIKKSYMSEKTLLGETGAGLVETEDMEKEIIVGSAIDNLWGEIKIRFPWFRRMQRLMGTSPLVIRDAVAHSTSQLNLDILDRVSASEVVKSPAESSLLVIDNDGEPSIETSEDNTRYSPFSFDADLPSEDPNDTYNEQSGSSSRSKQVTVSMQKANMKPETVTRVALNSTTATRRKGLLDGLSEMQEARRATTERLAGQLNRSREERVRIQVLADFEKEKLKLEHQAHKEELDRAHALTMQRERYELEMSARYGTIRSSSRVPLSASSSRDGQSMANHGTSDMPETFTGEDWHADFPGGPLV